MRRYERDDINLVFNTIILSDKDPISNKKLSLKTGLNRDRIRIICNQLEQDQNRITIIENGKRRSYIANPTIRERILRDQQKLDGYLLDVFFSGSIDVPCQDLPHYKKEFYTSHKEQAGIYTDEVLLYRFSLKLGSLLTYLFLKNMDPENFRKFTGREPSLTNDILMENWISNPLFLIGAYQYLRKRIRDPIYNKPVSWKKSKKGPSYYISKKDFEALRNRSMYALSKERIKKLYTAFEKLYPSIYHELEKINEKSIDIMNRDHLSIKQVACDHEYTEKREQKKTFYKCRQCEYEIIVQTDELIDDRILLEKINQEFDNRGHLSSYNFKCKKKHVWSKPSKPIKLFADNNDLYRDVRCKLCKCFVLIDVIDKNILDTMYDKVIEEINQDNTTINFFNDLKYIFYIHPNRNFTLDEIVDEITNMTLSYRKKISIENIIKNEDIIKILGIMIKFRFIKKTQEINRKEPQYIRISNW